jgi:ribosomal protein S12 methylthiotransferase
MKAGLVSLGCAKNLVDSEMILGVLRRAGVDIVPDPQDADVIIVNTCGFIESAKQEALDTIREMHSYGKKLLVCGCYAQRYADKLKTEMPFIDRIVTLREYPRFGAILNDLFMDKSLKFGELDYQNRLLATSRFSPYVKISDGCDNRCAYCAIPLIRGSFRSRPMADILAECEGLVKNGAKELVLISQDTTRYGTDLNPERRSLLSDLLNQVSRIEGLAWVRVLYLYPDEITDSLLETIRDNPKIAPYFDIPIQHVSTPLLRRMNRRGDETLIISLLDKIKGMIPHAVLRTTLIVGFSGENPEDFDHLKTFIQNHPFDRMGVFAYSREEDTASYSMDGQLPEDVKQSRLDDIMKLQKKIASQKNKEQVGRIHRTLVEDYDKTSKFYYGRSYAFAPDDVDGYIVFQSPKKLKIGDIVDVKITATFAYDLIGDAVSA